MEEYLRFFEKRFLNNSCTREEVPKEVLCYFNRPGFFYDAEYIKRVIKRICGCSMSRACALFKEYNNFLRECGGDSSAMVEYLKCFDAWYRTGNVHHVPYDVFEFKDSPSRSLHEFRFRCRINEKYGATIEKAEELLDDFDKALNKCFDKYLENLNEDYSNYKRLSVNLTTLRVVESGEFAQWAKHLNRIDKTDVKKFERYVRGEF